jgi:hypothetical protein
MATTAEVTQLLEQIPPGNRGQITRAVYDGIRAYDATFNSYSKKNARNSLGE